MTIVNQSISAITTSVTRLVTLACLKWLHDKGKKIGACDPESYVENIQTGQTRMVTPRLCFRFDLQWYWGTVHFTGLLNKRYGHYADNLGR